jgi:hypothetical protein
MTIQNLYPGSRPTLNLHFAKVKALDPRITFTRASSARYYDGKTVAKSEENLLIRSQEFTTSWTVSRVSVTGNNATAPDGTSTADTVTADGTSEFPHAVRQTISFAATGDKTISVFAKAGTNNFMQIYVGGNTNVFANFDLSGGTVGTVGSQCTAAILNVGSGWYRCSITTSQTNPTEVNFNIIENGTSVRAQAWATSNSILFWGAQLEQRSSVTAYTPTTTQPITNYVPVLLSAANNVARFDHNPVTGESLGLLIEESRTNLLLRSEEFDAVWVPSGVTVTANNGIAPDGTTTADRVVPTAVSGSFKELQQNLSITSGLTYTFSLYVKASGYEFVQLLGNSAAFGTFAINYELTTGTETRFTAGTSTVVGRSITPATNGWYRITVSVTALSTGSGRLGADIIPASNSTRGVSWTGDGTRGVFHWGAQVEVGAFPTSYIPTVASQVTRAADVAVMTGENFSSWFNQDQGSLYVDITPRHTGLQYAVIIGDGTNLTLGIGFFMEAGNLAARVRGSGGLSGIGGTVIAIPANTAFKAMLSYAAYNNAWAYNGENRSTGNTNIKPENSVSLHIGGNPIGGNTYTGTIRKLSFYPLKLTDAELQTLTRN